MENRTWDFHGCPHYQRKCKFITLCCSRIYTCRFCHDLKEKHPLDRKSIKQVVCTNCYHVQPPQKQCQKCAQVFGSYSCLECNLFDDLKGQFHCVGCGICRTGGAGNFFHCNTCDLCLPNELLNNHKCIENASRCNCSLCLEDLHTSRDPCRIPACGHLVHSTCYDTLKQRGQNNCTLCQKAW